MAETPAQNNRGFLNTLKILPLLNYLRDPLHKNAVFLIATSATSALIGFFFWTLAARLYPAEDVGRATAMVSAGNLIVILSGLGMGMGVLRFLAEEKDKNRLINTAITVVSSTALVLAIIFLLSVKLWSPALAFMQDRFLLIVAFIFLCIFQAVQLLNNYTFAALRKAQYAFYQSLITITKVILLLALVSSGTVVLFGSFTLGFVLAAGAGSLFFIRQIYPLYRLKPCYDHIILQEIFRFSVGNYVGEVLRNLPGVVIPLIVINTIGSAQNAYFYIAWMISLIYFTVAYAINMSLVAETAHDQEETRRHVFKTLKFAFIILIPAIIIVYFLGGFLLSFFGARYATEGLWLLRILIISSIPVAINETYVAICRIRKQVLPIILIYGFSSFLAITLGYMLLGRHGLIGIGIAWLSAHVLTMLIITITNRKQIFSSSMKRS